MTEGIIDTNPLDGGSMSADQRDDIRGDIEVAIAKLGRHANVSGFDRHPLSVEAVTSEMEAACAIGSLRTALGFLYGDYRQR